MADIATTSPTRPLARLRSRIASQERGWEAIALGFSFLALATVAALVWFVMDAAWPAIHANGINLFTRGSVNLDDQLGLAFNGSGGHPYTHLNALSGVLGTVLVSFGALVISVPFSILCAVFIAVLAPRRIRALTEPIVRLLAGVPSVVYGLFGLFVLAPFLERAFLSPDTIEAYGQAGLPLTGSSLLAALLIVAVTIAPVMIAVFVDALDNIPVGWTEGSMALGTDMWRATVRISLPSIRPALVAGTILGGGRALGEAIVPAMVAGSIAWIPNIKDGAVALMEPVHPLAALIVNNTEGMPLQPLTTDLFAFGAILLISNLALSLAARIALIPGRKDRRA